VIEMTFITPCKSDVDKVHSDDNEAEYVKTRELDQHRHKDIHSYQTSSDQTETMFDLVPSEFASSECVMQDEQPRSLYVIAELEESCEQQRQRDADCEPDKQCHYDDSSMAARSAQSAQTTSATSVTTSGTRDAEARSAEQQREFDVESDTCVNLTTSTTHFASMPRRQFQSTPSILRVGAIPLRYRKASTLFYFKRFQPRFKPCLTRCATRPAVAELKEEMESDSTSQGSTESKSTVGEETALTVDSADSTDIATSLSAPMIDIVSKFDTS